MLTYIDHIDWIWLYTLSGNLCCDVCEHTSQATVSLMETSMFGAQS